MCLAGYIPAIPLNHIQSLDSTLDSGMKVTLHSAIELFKSQKFGVLLKFISEAPEDCSVHSEPQFGLLIPLSSFFRSGTLLQI